MTFGPGLPGGGRSQSGKYFFQQTNRDKNLMLPIGQQTEYGDKTVEKQKVALRPSLAGAPPASLSPEVSLSVAQAIGKRWSRLERDIEKYNSQQGYGCGGWPQWDSIDAENLSSGWYGVDEILEEMEFEDMDAEDSLPGLQFSLDPGREISNGRGKINFDIVDNSESMDRADFQNMFLYGYNFNGNDLIFHSWDKRTEDINSDGTIDSAWIDLGLPAADQGPMPQMYAAASRRPIHNQPGMTAILAADHLSKRLSELERLASEQPDGLDKKQLAQQRAMQVAIKNIERTGARLEQNGQFWGHQGWTYRLRPRRVNPPTIQVYNNLKWSFDLTRYADGLYSLSLIHI